MRLNARLNRGLAAAALVAAAVWGLPAGAGAREPGVAGPLGAGPVGPAAAGAGWCDGFGRWRMAAVAPTPETDPDYAMWSRMAFQEARRLYTLLDYRYLGRAHVAPGVDQRRFRFWVRRHQHEFPLIVTIRYNPVTHKVFSIKMEEERQRGVPT